LMDASRWHARGARGRAVCGRYAESRYMVADASATCPRCRLLLEERARPEARVAKSKAEGG